MSGLVKASRNVAALMVAKTGGRVGNFVVFAVVGRHVAVDELGAYATATALACYFMVGSDAGLSTWLTRCGATQPERLAEVFHRAKGAKVPLTILSLALLLGSYCLLPHAHQTRLLFLLVGAAGILESHAMLNEGVCRAVERMEFEGVAGLLRTAVFVGGAAAWVALGGRLWSLGLVSVAAVVCQVAVTSFFAARFVSSGINFRGTAGTLKEAVPYGATSVTAVAFGQIDVVIMSVIAGAEVVGRYAAVSRLLLVLGIIPVLASTAMMPALTRLWAEADRARFCRMVGQLVTLASLAAAGTFVVLTFFGREVMLVLYGHKFEGLGGMLGVGSSFLLCRCFSAVLGTALTAAGRQKARTAGVVLGLAATVALVSLLVPGLGIAGAVLALVGSEVVLAAAYLYAMKAHFWGRRLVEALVVSLVPAAVALAGGRLLSGASTLCCGAGALLAWAATTALLTQAGRAKGTQPAA